MFIGLTNELCQQALELVKPSIKMANELLGRTNGHLGILDPTIPYEPKYHKGFEHHGFEDLVLFEHTIGEPDDKYRIIGRSKGYISFVTGLPSHLVQFEAPWAYEPGMTKYGGSAVETFGGNSRLIVYYSGAPWQFDYMYCRMMIAAIQATCRSELAPVLDSDVVILGCSGLEPSHDGDSQQT